MNNKYFKLIKKLAYLAVILFWVYNFFIAASMFVIPFDGSYFVALGEMPIDELKLLLLFYVVVIGKPMVMVIVGMIAKSQRREVLKYVAMAGILPATLTIVYLAFLGKR